MKIHYTAFLLLALLTGCSKESAKIPSYPEPGSSSHSSSSTQKSSVNPTPAVILAPVTIPDPARGNMPAYQLLVPQGWRVEGGFTPVTSGYHMIPYFSDVKVEAPDKRGVRFWGPQEFGYADGVHTQPFNAYQGRPFMPLQNSLGDFWTFAFRVAPAQGVTDLRIIEEEVMPEATELVQQHLAPLYQSTAQENAQLSYTGEGKTFDVHVRRLVIQYKEHGTPIEATIFASVRHAIYYYPDRSIRAAMWNLDNMYGVYGPVGTDYLNDPVLAAVVRSRKQDPNWTTAIETWYLQKNRQIVAEGNTRIAAAARAAATTKTSQSEDVLDISFNGWKKRNEMNSTGQSLAVNGIHEQTTYSTPYNGTVNLPSYYQNVYTDPLGNVVMHHDANYDIHTDPAFSNHNWQRIQPVR